MSKGRSNFSALSRLAQQWSEDDEQEQIRERRRRNRIMENSDKDVKESTKDNSSCFSQGSLDTSNKDKNSLIKSKEGQQTNKEKKEEKQAPKSQPAESQGSVNKKEEFNGLGNQIEKSKINQKEEINATVKAIQEKHVTSSKEEESKNLGSRREEEQIPSRHKDETTASKNLKQDAGEKTEANHEFISQSKDCKGPDDQTEECKKPQSQQNVIQKLSIRKGENPKNQSPESGDKKMQRTVIKVQSTSKSSGEQRADRPPSITSISSAMVNVTPTDTAESCSSTVTIPNTDSTSKFKSQVFVSSVKIARKPSTSDMVGGQQVLSPPPVTDRTEESAPTVTRTLKKIEMQIPPTNYTHVNTKEDELHKSPPATSPLKRCSPQTSSFRIASQSEDQADSGLMRSSSLRFSLRSRKLGDRMEKYASAIQRSESVRVTSHSRGVLGPSTGIASKKTIFEKDENASETNISNTKKDLNIPVKIADRINQWKSSRTQEGTDVSTGNKDIRTGDVASKRNLWQQRSQSSSDTKL
ncbi:ladinin-1 isoform X2 [Bombina bombina]|uniref:ladinin-1 isoform X2 n=1 Tax=Bombina bombina TaxID=8345 RepID=UPI00235A980C|nr:ladinin-1 isoform X2 [Bombina bombina]